MVLFAALLGTLGCSSEKDKKLAVGDQAPEFTATNLQGIPLSLRQYTGAPVILRFFIPDCKYCKADTAIFNEYYQRYSSKGLEIIYLSTSDNIDEVKQFVDKLEVKFPVALDGKQQISSLYNVKIFPQTIILNPEHEIIGAVMGGVSRAELDEFLGKFLTAEPISKDDRCAVCGMFVAKYPDWLSQVRHDNGTVLNFDGVKDLMVYYFDRKAYSTSDNGPIAEIWVKDHYTLTWIDGLQAFYVTGSDTHGPMGHEFIPFSTKAAAENFLRDHSGREILTFSEISSELVESMRHGSTMKN